MVRRRERSRRRGRLRAEEGMPSPFPGMNPYLEQSSVWHDFHNSFIAAARDDIAAQVDPDYFVRIDEQVYIHEWPVAAGRADFAVTNASTRQSRRPDVGMVVAEVTTSNAVVNYPKVEEERLSFLEIRDRKS